MSFSLTNTYLLQVSRIFLWLSWEDFRHLLCYQNYKFLNLLFVGLSRKPVYSVKLAESTSLDIFKQLLKLVEKDIAFTSNNFLK